MAHQSLYRTYRPQCFEDVVGQSHVTRTLRNAVAEGTVAHAYLFTGPRGTGKTTTARILAKALDCEKGPTPDFDDTCQNCRDIADGRHPDVYELDAASRTGVDAIRDEIITKVSYAATRGGWKVYIIDEVHMLSTSAFNALLKTLEEPPARVVFVLCTTHPHKVPETIHSRCQRFDFRRISTEDIVERLQQIADAEGIRVAPGALTLIAKHAAGGMRDAISTLDQLSAFTGKSISMDDVEGLLGEVDTALLFGVADAILRRDVAACFRQVAVLAEAGVDVPEFVKGLTAHFRDLFVTAAVGDASGIVDATDDDMQRLSSQAQEFGRDRLGRVLEVLGTLSSEMRWAGDARLALEVALVRMARPEGELTLEALAERVSMLESSSSRPAAVAGCAADGRGAASPTGEAETPPLSATQPAPAAPREAAAADRRAGGATGPSPGATPDSLGGGSTSASSFASGSSAPSDAGSAASADPTASVEAAPPAASAAPASGSLDRAGLKRAWPAVVAEIKKRRNAVAHLFVATAVEVDGDTLVVEFPSDQKLSMELAHEAETLQLLRQSVNAVLGVTPAVRYQLGRGAVHPAAPEPAHRAPSPGPAMPHVERAEAPRDHDGGETSGTAGEPDPVDLLASEFGDIVVEHHEDE